MTIRSSLHPPGRFLDRIALPVPLDEVAVVDRPRCLQTEYLLEVLRLRERPVQIARRQRLSLELSIGTST